jgi:hypothetical protein
MSEERLRNAMERDYARDKSSQRMCHSQMNMNQQIHYSQMNQQIHPNQVIMCNGEPCVMTNQSQFPIPISQLRQMQPMCDRVSVEIPVNVFMQKHCGVQGCRYNHTQHMCNGCGNPNANHLEQYCPNVMQAKIIHHIQRGYL